MNPALHESLLRYGNAFQSIKRNRSLGIHAPHKIVLLLAILELFEKETLKSNCIAPTQELQNHFERIWQSCVVSNHHCNKAYPFVYLRQDGFWQLIPDYKPANSAPTLGQLHAEYVHAQLSHELFTLCQILEGRLQLRKVLSHMLEEDGQNAYQPPCPFCRRDFIGEILAENRLSIAFYARFPLSPDTRSSFPNGMCPVSLTFKWKNICKSENSALNVMKSCNNDSLLMVSTSVSTSANRRGKPSSIATFI